MNPHAVMVRVVSLLTGADPKQPIRCEMRWLATAEGRLELVQEAIVPKAFPLVPRIGTTWTLAPGMRDVRWFGRGPWENYCDRKESAMPGEYRLPIASMLEPYLCPGECGGREDVRTLSVLDASGQAALHVEGAPRFHFSALHVSRQDLATATHRHELQPRPETFLHLDGWHMGVGGDNGWQRNVHPEFLLPSGTYRWRLTIQVG
jgi:beta-galactosidase